MGPAWGVQHSDLGVDSQTFGMKKVPLDVVCIRIGCVSGAEYCSFSFIQHSFGLF